MNATICVCLNVLDPSHAMMGKQGLSLKVAWIGVNSMARLGGFHAKNKFWLESDSNCMTIDGGV